MTLALYILRLRRLAGLWLAGRRRREAAIPTVRCDFCGEGVAGDYSEHVAHFCELAPSLLSKGSYRVAPQVPPPGEVQSHDLGMWSETGWKRVYGAAERRLEVERLAGGRGGGR